MNGPEHYRRAQELAERAAGWPGFDRWPMSDAERIGRQQADAATAQVHATLALAATQVETGEQGGRLTMAQTTAWRRAGALGGATDRVPE